MRARLRRGYCSRVETGAAERQWPARRLRAQRNGRRYDRDPLTTQKSAPTGSFILNFSQGSSCCHPQSSIPISSTRGGSAG
jgi:hypothetical protein